MKNLGKIFSAIGGPLVGGVTALLGNRSNNNAAKYAADVGAKTAAQALALQQQQLDEERNQWTQSQAEAKRQWEAQQAQYAQQWAAQQEDRQYNRTLSDYNLGLAKARDARRAPYLAMSQQALASLGQMLGLH